VCKDNIEHIFSQFGSGTLSGCPTYWSKYCTFDPHGAWREYQRLTFWNLRPLVYIHPDCAVTTPYDVIANRTGEMEHGTCGTGFYRTKKRHFGDQLTLTVADLVSLNLAGIQRKLKKIRDYYKADRVEAENTFLDCVACIRHPPVWILMDSVPGYSHTVFEGSQGLMLDEHIGHMPHCSPSDITPRNAMKMKALDEVWLVTRCYQTRHGNGPMTNVEHPVLLTNNEKETNKLDKYQGEFRISVLDLDQLLHAKVEGIDKVVPAPTRANLVVTCTDQVDTYEVSIDGNFFTFHNVERFVRAVGEALKINGDLYVNTSPYATTVRSVRK
jgi:adenylosuccinate synthase